MNNLTIRQKIFAVSLLPLTVTALLLSGIYLWQRVKDIDAKLNDNLYSTASIIASAGEFDIVSRNQRALQQLIAAYATTRDILRIQVIDKHGNHLAEHINNTAPGPVTQHGTTHETDLIIVKKAVIPAPALIHDIIPEDQPNLIPDSDPVGYIIVTGTQQHADTKKFSAILQSILLTAFALALTALFAYLLSRSVSKPLIKIASAVKKFSEGNLQHFINVDTGGEIGDLQRHINEMAASLIQARELERQQAANILYIEKSKALTTLESLGEGVITTDCKGIITYINPAATRLTGYSQNMSVGTHLHQVFRTLNTSTFQTFEYPIQSCIEFGTIIRHDARLRLIRHDGSEIVIRDTATVIRDNQDNAVGAVLIFDDFTSMHSMAERLAHQAAHDDLTGLFNRREFENRLEMALHDIRTEKAEHTLCYIDLDQFKVINDTCGHTAGDELLRQLAELIRSKIRHHDILARLGGDEFGIILKDCQADKARIIAAAILEALGNYVFTWEGRRQLIGASIGQVRLDRTMLTVTDALIAADSACYIAKEQGRNRIHVFTPTDAEVFKRQGEMQWFMRIKESLSQENFELHVQRITALSAHGAKQYYYEVLLRLRYGNNIYSPESFLSTAERYNLMPQIDRWVINETFSMLARHTSNHRARELPHFSINLSGQSLGHDDFHEFIHERLINSGINPAAITFEITETAAIANLTRAISFMRAFRNLGCRFALDDFGSGLSSFGYLTTLPLDYIKIDGRLISEIRNNPINISIVDAINRIAHQMKLLTIAEYVEDEQLLEHVRALGIDYAQGFALSPLQPMNTVLTT